ncbi:hypothetical protein NSQ96_17130 [Caldifermentibacillus hisashii]
MKRIVAYYIDLWMTILFMQKYTMGMVKLSLQKVKQDSLPRIAPL